MSRWEAIRNKTTARIEARFRPALGERLGIAGSTVIDAKVAPAKRVQ